MFVHQDIVHSADWETDPVKPTKTISRAQLCPKPAIASSFT
jgi:hypothetical protein